MKGKWRLSLTLAMVLVACVLGAAPAHAATAMYPVSYPSAALDLDVQSWERAPDGLTTAWLYLDAWGLGGVGDPCEIGVAACTWSIETGHYDSGGNWVRYRLVTSGGASSSGAWYFDKSKYYSALAPSSLVSHVRAKVVSNLPGREILTSDVRVGDLVLDSTDLTQFEPVVAAAVAAAGVGSTAACDPLLFLMPEPDGNVWSPPREYLVCVQAVVAGATARGIAKAVVAAGGVAALYQFLAEDDTESPRPPIPLPPPLLTNPFPLDEQEAEDFVPEPAAAGSGAQYPPNCMNDAERQSYLESLPLQTHHLASITHMSKWTPLFQEIADFYGVSLKGDWNTITVPHKGPHPYAYHEWVYHNMEKARAVARGDFGVFKDLFRQGSAARSVDISYEGRSPSGRMSLCRRGFPRSSSAMWCGSPVAVI